MKSFSYTELDKLAGEVLPERAVLSTLLVGGGNDNENGNLNLNQGNGHGTTAVTPLCQATTFHSQGLAAVAAANDSSSFACSGAAVVSGH